MRRIDLASITLDGWSRLDDRQRQRFAEMFLRAALSVDRRGGSPKGECGPQLQHRSGVRTLSGPLDVPPLKRETHCGTTGERHESP